MSNITFAEFKESYGHEEELMSNEGYIACAIVLFLIGFFGFFLNLFVIILMCTEKQLWTPLNVILFNLVCSDFSVSILGNPFTLTSSIAHSWIFGHVMCVIYGFFMSLLGITSITTLTVLAFERYIMVSKPFHKQRLTRRGAVFTVIGIWVYSLALTTPPLFGWSDYVNEAANISCSVNWEEQTFSTTTYILFLFFFGLVVPVIIISYSYLNIIRTMKRNTLRIGRVSKAEGRITYMVAVMIAAFLIAWTPYAILALLTQFGNADYVSPAMGVVPALVAKSSICYNPLIYVGLNTQFKTSLKHMLGFGGITDNSMIEINENTVDPHRIDSQMTQDSFAGGKLQMREMTITKFTKTYALRQTMLKMSYSESYLNSPSNMAVTYFDTNGKTWTKFTKSDETGKNHLKKEEDYTYHPSGYSGRINYIVLP